MRYKAGFAGELLDEHGAVKGYFGIRYDRAHAEGGTPTSAMRRLEHEWKRAKGSWRDVRLAMAQETGLRLTVWDDKTSEYVSIDRWFHE